MQIGLADFFVTTPTAWGPFFAASVIATVPVVLVSSSPNAGPAAACLSAGCAEPRKELKMSVQGFPLKAGVFYRTGEEIALTVCLRVHASGRTPGARRSLEAEVGKGARFSGLVGGTHSIEALAADGSVLAEELDDCRGPRGERPVHGFATSFDDESIPAVLTGCGTTSG